MIFVHFYFALMVFVVFHGPPYLVAYTADDESFLNENYMNITQTPPCGMPADIQSGSADLGDSHSTIWPDGILYYEIDDFVFDSNHVRQIKAGMEMIERQTRIDGRDCIKFVERRSQSNWVRIINDRGCYSSVGRLIRRGAQQVSLQIPGCLGKETVAHELIHALGFNHEQTRPDRDQWIQINYNNIESSMRHNFEKSENYQDLDTPYDYKSIMHYEETAFAKNTRFVTMKALKPPYTLKRNYELSSIDVEEIRKLYNCKSATKTIAPGKTTLAPKIQTTKKHITSTLINYLTTISSSSEIFQKTRFHNHYEAYSAETLQICWSICLNDKECRAVTFTKLYSACFLYNTESPQRSSDNDFTSIAMKKKQLSTTKTSTTMSLKTTTESTESIENYIIYKALKFLDPYMSKEASLQSCLNGCENSKICLALSFDHEDSYCHYYNTDSLINKTDSDFTSLKKLQNKKKTESDSTKNFDNFEKKRFLDHYMLYTSKDIENCWHACAVDSDDCKAVSYNSENKYCYLYKKSDLSSTIDAKFNSIALKKGRTHLSSIVKKTLRSYQALVQTRFHDYYESYVVESIENCWKICGNYPDKCKSITFYHPSGYCNLFHSDSPKSSVDSQFTSYTTKKGSQKGDNLDYETLLKTRLLGHYKELATDNANNCWLACDDELACNAITFYGSGFLNSNKNCFFYTSKEPARTHDDDFTSIVRKKIENFADEMPYLEFPETWFDKYDKLVQKIKNIDDCWNLCEYNQTGCNAVTYHHIDKSCFLYNSGKRASGTNKNYTSYVRKNEIQKNQDSLFTFFKETRLHGHFKESYTDNKDECWSSCNDEDLCNGITFYHKGFLNHNKNCFLYKQKNPEKSSDKDFSSIVRKN